MRNAIILGGSGLIGSFVAKYFYSKGINVLCLGKRCLNSQHVLSKFGYPLTYTSLDLLLIDSLACHIKSLDLPWDPSRDTVFFNFAWRGSSRLTDGSFGEQLNNAIIAAEAVKQARNLGCSKFINCGSMEETLIEHHLSFPSEHPYKSSQTNYGLAKLASRDMCRMVSYLEKIDYVHTRISAPFAISDNCSGYIASTIKKILRSEPYDPPSSSALYDLIHLTDVARAYYHIGLDGCNKADYFIGTGNPMPLQCLFQYIQGLVDHQFASIKVRPSPLDFLFDVKPIFNDTSFLASLSLEKFLKSEISS